ncbi:MAG: (d)CMP kinase [Peptoniphilaceae bacterium]
MYSIAIDGPGGSGKSTLARMLADQLDITYIDTGSMYRSIAYKILKSNINLNNLREVKDLLSNTKIDYYKDSIYLDGEDISEDIRSEEISKEASKISQIKEIREYLTNIQKEISEKRSLVMEGRDIGTVVIPKASFKFFLVASSEVRAKRRYKQLLEKGQKVKFEDIKRELEKRDYNDINRKHSPLKKAKDAIVIDTSNMSLNETLDYMLKIIRGKDVI